MSYTVIIPARYGSSRLPAKPLADIDGRPMIAHVVDRASRSGAARVVVATDDQRIQTAVSPLGVETLMTHPDHPSGTDRLQQAAALLQLANDDIVVNVQGDEPLIPPAVIDQVAANLAANPDCGMATLCEPIQSVAQFLEPGAVKVVSSVSGRALYFSRAPIPWPRDAFAKNKDQLPDALIPMRHIGIYAYRVRFLNAFIGWPMHPLEAHECLEQLRALANDVAIHVAPACEPIPAGVDTAADLERVRAMVAAGAIA